MNDTRVENLEKEVVDLKLVTLGMQKDIHSMAESVKSIDQSIRKFSEIHQTLMVRDEHFIGLLKEVRSEVEDAKRMAEAAQDMVNGCSQLLDKRVTKIEDNADWAVKIIVGAVLISLVALVVSSKGHENEILQSIGFRLQGNGPEPDEPGLPSDAGRAKREVRFSFHSDERIPGDDA